MENKIYHYFYKITNKVNGKFYYGIHSTDDIDNGYMGSGKRLNRAIKKYGIENFTKEIVKFFDTLQELSDYESLIVNDEMVSEEMCYNLVKGGYYIDDDAIEKRRMTYGRIKHQQGSKNSQYGTCWMTKDGNSIKVKKQDVEKYLTEGWSKGRCITNKTKLTQANQNRTHIWKDGICKNVKTDVLQTYLDDGWIIGRMDPKDKIKKVKMSRECSIQQLKNFVQNKVKVIDKSGNIFVVDKNDPRYINGEFINTQKGMIATIDKEGKSHYVSVNDARYLSGELIPKNVSAKGKVSIRDKNGKYYLVDKNDSRVTSGDYVMSTKGLKYTEEQRRKIKEAKTKTKMTWVNNGIVHKYLPLCDIDSFLNNNPDWEQGRIKK